MQVSRYWITIGAVLGGMAVILGAFGAHGLQDVLTKIYPAGEMETVAGFEVPASWKYLQDFSTGADYQMIHSLALVLVGLLAARQPRRSLNVAGWCFLLGIVFFSGSLYLLTLTGARWLGAIAPVGGTLFIVGWFLLAYMGCPCISRDEDRNE